MKNYLSVLAFEARMRWPLMFLPVVFIAIFSWGPRPSVSYSMTLPSMSFLGFQMMLMLAPIFQNRYFGVSKAQWPGLDFSFTLPISRRTLYEAKATIYLLGSLSVVLTYLVVSLYDPNLRIKLFPDSSPETLVVREFYLTQFSGAIEEVDASNANNIYVCLPGGRVWMALTMLAMTWGGMLFYQLMLGIFRNETRFQQFVQFGLGIVMIFSCVMVSFSVSLKISVLARLTAFVSHWATPMFLLLILATVAVSWFCSRRFATREIL